MEAPDQFVRCNVRATNTVHMANAETLNYNPPLETHALLMSMPYSSPELLFFLLTTLIKSTAQMFFNKPELFFEKAAHTLKCVFLYLIFYRWT